MHPHAGKVGYPNPSGAEAPGLGTLPDFTLRTSFSGRPLVAFIIPFIINH